MKNRCDLIFLFCVVLSANLFFTVPVSAMSNDAEYMLAESFKETNYSSGGCVAWARDRVKELLGFRLPSTGNQPSGVYGASNWWYNLEYPRGQTPDIHALAIWSGGKGKNGKYGHVAFVEDVGTTTIGGVTLPLITLSEGGFSSEENGVKHGSYTSMNRTSSGYEFLGYVYVDESHVPADASYEKLEYPKTDEEKADDDKTDNENTVVTVDMYRLYNPNSGEHFYTSDAAERDMLSEIGWKYEGVAWQAPKTSDTPVYRVYNPNSGEHHYTLETVEKEYLVSIGWKDEGIGWYSDDTKGTGKDGEKIGAVSLYRLYNPNAKGETEAGAHHYTKEASERDYLVSVGWNDEGIGWYGR